MPMHRVKTCLLVLAAVLCTCVVALAEHTKTVNIYTDATLPGGQQLKAGKYAVTVDESSKQVSFKQGDKVLATSGCQVVAKPEKNPCSEARFGQKDNKPLLEEIRLGGERRSILLIQ